ncbi:iron-sulfur cluster assembly scaffold protein [Candidatus Woesearchaeota archaeon]|jgi:nitrogen fixation protein NifU and related proteins|nr:iron-sulfur cluster assembly scaffold protein [Candidatus Woesearchaeota archaeon]
MYSEKVKQRFMNPKRRGEVKNPDAKVLVQSEICGDEMEISFKVKNGKITECKFQTFGCAASTATSDMLCELAEGKTIEEAEHLTREDVIHGLGDLPAVKLHCSDLATKALKAAIDQYKKKK